MDFVEKKFKIFKNFAMLLRFYQQNYGEYKNREKDFKEKEVIANYDESFNTLKNENSLFIVELETEQSKKEKEYRELQEELSNIKLNLLKTKHEMMLEKLKNIAIEYGQDSSEYYHLKLEVHSLGLDLKHYEEIKYNISKLKGELIRFDDTLKFHKVLILFAWQSKT